MKILFALCILTTLVSSAASWSYFWTPWLDRDDPSVTGDWENYASFKPAPCKGGTPVYAQCRLKGSRVPWYIANQIMLGGHTCTSKGLVCVNKHQLGSRKYCRDYEIRFLCYKRPAPIQYWTRWLDRDNPSGTGDWETYASFKPAPCRSGRPVAAQCRLKGSGLPWQTARQVMLAGHACTSKGLVCRNKDQRGPHKYCKDYEIRFRCQP